MAFRNLPKQPIQTTVPREIRDEIKRRSFKEDRPENEIIVRGLCLGFGLDPSKFGLDLSSQPSNN